LKDICSKVHEGEKKSAEKIAKKKAKLDEWKAAFDKTKK